MKKILILGTITFDHFSGEFAHIFDDNKAKTNALIHNITAFMAHHNELYLQGIGEGSGQDYVIVNQFEGEIGYIRPELRTFAQDVIHRII